ncbi:Ig-like domain-containing protein [Candidatus Lucifugimonas marina]|uniref:Bacterial Ig-like domain-containing protein n=1 Tax=Candidatus Lucifugimonas marina TaxID=3038979 RepID=A0AAJ6CVI9_9CHLR|nr:hypothetical protein [SAR202 cluster bacterium JH702]MDG0870142.1 hypothetical protein [SAR202 cluster bacterium JH639]WFG36301.1 hypothetical protein GKN94_11590 [SAR202 cluster bacterium JH545]WFG40234.1 hypothetical protein GKO48_11625 [SAR202 cluster bacterium JH1073]
MKLSVKLLSGLTLIALVAVAVVGLSHSASAAADAKVYVTNKASGLTTEPSTAVSGRTSATTVYGTYKSYASTGTSARDIVADSDRFIVTIIDADLNATTTITSDEDGTGYDADAVGTDVLQIDGTGLDSTDDAVQLTLTDEVSNPIIGTDSDIKVLIAGTSTVVTGITATIDFAGDGTNPPLVRLDVDFGTHADGQALDIQYPSSKVDVTTATVKSVVDTGGTAVLTLTETGRNTGRFEGEVLVRERWANAGAGQFTAGLAGDGTTGDPAEIPAVGGPITVTYVDAATSGTATNVNRTASYKIDTTVPTATISTPASGSETQNRLPTFTGTVTDNQSGLDVSAFSLNIDDNTDAANANMVISAGNNLSLPTVIGKVASIDVSAHTDGTTSLPFSYTETVVLPNAGVTNPDHTVDFQVRAADLAGNYGYSDSDSSVGNDGTGRHGAQPHTIKIDQVIPQISSADSGVGLDTSVSPTVDKANVRDTIKVTFDGKIKDTSVSASDFQVVFSGAGGTFVPASVTVKDAVVYLDLDTTIPSDNKPTVKIQGTIQDLAGNSTDAGSAVANDKLAPVVTVTQSGGSAAGDPDGLTNDKMTVSVASDEDLQGPPAITVTDLTPDPDVTVTGFNSTLAVAQGGNTWSLVVTKSSSASGDRAVKVVATDSAGNSATVGKDTTKTYVLDLAVAAATSSPATSTTQSNPFLTTDFSSDQSALSVTEATLDDVDVTSQVIASANSKKFFFQPTTALTNKEHTYVVKVTDAAGNTATVTNTFTKSDRTDFVLELFAGWNAVSLPSNPLDTDVNTVLSNTGVKQVVAYDATTPSQPWRIASKVGSGAYTSQTTPGLSTVSAGPGYWVETSDFEDQKISLEGPTGPGDARPGLTTIATGNGWNLVGVVDQSRTQTQADNKGTSLTRPDAGGTNNAVKSSAYFNTVNNGRAYTFDTVDSEFRELVDTDNVTIGSGIWVFISPQDNGQLPHIVP